MTEPQITVTRLCEPSHQPEKPLRIDPQDNYTVIVIDANYVELYRADCSRKGAAMEWAEQFVELNK